NRLLIGSFARLGERPHLISPFDSWHPAWSPDGMKLAYFSNETGAIHLWIYDVESQQRRPVGHLAVNTLPLETRYWPVWSADGSSVFASFVSSRVDEGGTPRRNPYYKAGAYNDAR